MFSLTTKMKKIKLKVQAQELAQFFSLQAYGAKAQLTPQPVVGFGKVSNSTKLVHVCFHILEPKHSWLLLHFNS